MPRITITRNRQSVGFLEAPESILVQPTVMLPGLEGAETGFAVVTEVDNRPVAALIFPFDGDTIELSHPFQWSSESFVSPEREQPQLERTRLSEAPSLFDLAGDIRVLSEGEEFDVRFSTEFRGRTESEGGGSFRLEIDDEGREVYLRCDFRGERGTGEGHFRGRFRSSAREGVAEADARFKFYGDFLRGYGEGHARAVPGGNPHRPRYCPVG